MQKLAGTVFIVGSLLFLYAAFSPIANLYFLEPDIRKRIEIIEADRTGWDINSGLFAAGAAVAAVGLLLFALHIRRSQDAATRILSYLAAGAAAVPAALGIVGYAAGLNRTPQEIVTATADWTFSAYASVILTQLALLTTGVVLLRAGYPQWFGWTVLILTALTVIVLVLVRAFPPMLFYFITLFIGVVLAAMPTVGRSRGLIGAAGAPAVTAPE
jgi:hypothetical protein